MKIQKYKAIITDSNKEVIGYISEVREYIGNGSYSTGVDYLISVTELSMPKGDYGVFKVIPESIKPLKLEINCNCSENVIYTSAPFIDDNNNPYCRWCGENFKTN